MGANNSGRYVGLHGTVMARMAAAILSYDHHVDDNDDDGCIDDGVHDDDLNLLTLDFRKRLFINDQNFRDSFQKNSERCGCLQLCDFFHGRALLGYPHPQPPYP